MDADRRKELFIGTSAVRRWYIQYVTRNQQIQVHPPFLDGGRKEKAMACKAARPTDEYHGWECEITGEACMFLIPNSKACAEKYREGPDADQGQQADPIERGRTKRRGY